MKTFISMNIDNILQLITDYNKSKYKNDIIDPFDNSFNIDKIKQALDKIDISKIQSNVSAVNDNVINELLNTNGFFRVIYEQYLFNIIPKSITNELYTLNIDVTENKADIQNLFDNILKKIDTLLYKAAHLLITTGGFGLWLVDKTKIKDILDKKLIKHENLTIDDFINYNTRPYYENNKNQIKQTNIDNLEYIIVHKSRIKPIKILNMFTIGYIIIGNITEDLSVANTISNTNNNKEQINLLFDLFKKMNIQINQKDKEEIIKFVGDKEYIFIPNSEFSFIQLEQPYDKGLLINLEWHSKLLSILRLLLANHAMKFQDLLIVKVDANEIAKPKVGEYLQAALTGLKSRLYVTGNNNIPITSLPNMLTPLQLLFIPTYSGKDAINFEYMTLNFNTDLANVLEQVRNDIATDSGIPYPLLVNDQIDMQILSQLNGLFYQKIVYIQTQIENGLKDFIDKIIYKVDPDLYFTVKDLYEFKLNKPIQPIIQQLSDVINNIVSFSVNLENQNTATILQRLLKMILGDEFAKLFDLSSTKFKDLIEVKIKDILNNTTTSEQNTEEQNASLF